MKGLARGRVWLPLSLSQSTPKAVWNGGLHHRCRFQIRSLSKVRPFRFLVLRLLLDKFCVCIIVLLREYGPVAMPLNDVSHDECPATLAGVTLRDNVWCNLTYVIVLQTQSLLCSKVCCAVVACVPSLRSSSGIWRILPASVSGLCFGARSYADSKLPQNVRLAGVFGVVKSMFPTPSVGALGLNASMV